MIMITPSMVRLDSEDSTHLHLAATHRGRLRNPFVQSPIMAELEIQTTEVLPLVCVRCGRQASGFAATEFHWEEPKEELSAGDKASMGVGLVLDIASGSGGLSRRPNVLKTLTLNLPFCDQHRRTSRPFRYAILLLPLLAVLGLVLLALDGAAEQEESGALALLGMLMILGSAIALGVVLMLRRPLKVRTGNDKKAIVKELSPAFVEAVQVLRGTG